MSSRRSRSGGRCDHDHAQTVIKVFTKLFFADGALQVAMRGGDDAHIHGDRFLAAEALQAFFLKHAHEFHLRAGRHVANLVEENRAAVRLLEAADAPQFRAGERAALVAEQFAFEQRFGNRRAVDGDERRLRAVAVLVNRARDEFLAGAGFAANQHVDRLGGDAADLLVNGLHRAAACR